MRNAWPGRAFGAPPTDPARAPGPRRAELTRATSEFFLSHSESTYDRLKWFSISSMVLLICLGVYQILHMRSFLKKKKAI